MLGVEARNFVQLDIGILGPLHGFAGHPPLGAGQACGQVCASPGVIVLPGRRRWAATSPWAGSQSRTEPTSLPSTTASYQRQTTTAETPGAPATATR